MSIEQIYSRPSVSLKPKWRSRDSKESTRSTDVNLILIAFLVLTGSLMQSYANGTIGAFLVALFLLIIGLAMISFVFPGKRYELEAFLLTYGVCLFVGGVAQCYSLAVFNTTESTIDSLTFLRAISPEPPFVTLANISRINAPLAVVIWQQMYKVTWFLGFAFGAYAGVMFNAFIMGLSASLTVRTSYELFGEDAWRLQRVGWLFAFCGLFILFGAVLIRDCFTTFFNALVLWGIVRWLLNSTVRNFLFAIVLAALATYAMFFLRVEAVLLFVVFWFLAFLFWFFIKPLNMSRLVVIIVAVGMLIVVTPYFVNYIENAQHIQVTGMESYAKLATNQHSDDSLGLRLVVNQPLPIRLILGFGALLINPIPLWINFQIGALDYNWIKGYHGLYQLFVFPLAVAGCIGAFRLFKSDRKQAVLLLFLTTYLFMNVELVVATSLEQRHFAQFMSALMILAAAPDTREKQTRTTVKYIATVWVLLVLGVHLAWMFMKGMT